MSTRLCALLLVTCTLAGWASAQCSSPGSHIAAWWDGTMDGALARDLVSTAPAQPVGGVGFVSSPGFSAEVFAFDGIDDHLDAEVPVVDGNPAFTVEFWIRASSTGSVRGLVTELGTAASVVGQFAVRLTADNSIEFLRLGSPTTATRVATSPVIPSGTWTHVAATYGGGTDLQIYVNGVSHGSPPATVAFSSGVTSAVSTLVGCTSSGVEPFGGELDEVTVYLRELPQDEIQRIFVAGNQWKCKTAAPVPADLLGWWSGDTCRGFASDSAGLNAGLLVGNATTAASGIVGETFAFTANHVDFGRPIVRTTGAFSVEGWMRRTNSGGSLRAIFHETGTGGAFEGRFMFRILSDGRLSFFRYTGSGLAVDNLVAPSSTAVPYARWTHVAAVYGGPGDMRLYKDGALVASGPVPSSATPSQPLSAFVGGSGPGTASFVGQLDEISVYRRGLEPNEIEAIYRAGRWGKDRAAAPPAVCVDGSGDDFVMTSTVNDAGQPNAPTANVATGDVLVVTMSSPGGTHELEPFALLGQLYAASNPPQGVAGFPELAFDLPATFMVFDGLSSTPFGATLLPPGGLELAFVIPPALGGTRARLQALVLSGQATNQFFATSNPLDLLAE